MPGIPCACDVADQQSALGHMGPGLRVQGESMDCTSNAPAGFTLTMSTFKNK